MTDKNTLKNWFRNGLKPTQEQFWAWLDSYFHKSEKIPQMQIEGLDESLANKADASQLNGKAEKDASGLTEENIISWKEALGVGELPSNIATVDSGDVEGNVHTKEQIVTLLENSGKNIGNSDLKVPEGVVRVLDISNAKFQIKGLENRASDSSFNKKIKTNDKGELVVSDEADVVVNIPSEVTVSGSPINATMNVNINHIFPSNNTFYTPSFLEELKNIMKTYSSMTFTKLVDTDFNLKTKDDVDIGKVVSASGDISIITSNKINLWEGFIGGSDYLLSLKSKKILPRNQNWILRIQVGSFSESLHSEDRVKIGIVQGDSDIVSYGIKGSIWGGSQTITGSASLGDMSRQDFECLMIKIDNTITTMMTTSRRTIYDTADARQDLGDYTPAIVMKGFNDVNCKMSYKILD
ncbi:hypothetical protein PG614_08255 [Riemerella anatipestifer]|nr:hypothetical protein [Riemerella anatipestifer]MDY3533535.1 hypothetical protein [Riemerella anatipestifer]MDY3535940.1 hypothetical protein [Riemerella anatipestifer]